MLTLGMVSVLHRLRAGAVLFIGGVAEGVRPGVRGLELQAVAHLVLEKHLQRVVTGGSTALVQHDGLVSPIRPEQRRRLSGYDQRLRQGRNLVDVQVAADMDFMAAHVIHFQDGLFSGRNLIAEAVLITGRIGAGAIERGQAEWWLSSARQDGTDLGEGGSEKKCLGVERRVGADVHQVIHRILTVVDAEPAAQHNSCRA